MRFWRLRCGGAAAASVPPAQAFRRGRARPPERGPRGRFCKSPRGRMPAGASFFQPRTAPAQTRGATGGAAQNAMFRYSVFEPSSLSSEIDRPPRPSLSMYAGKAMP